MTLLEFIRSTPSGASLVATNAVIAPAFVYQIAHGKRTASAALSRAIEAATKGAVMRWDLRPDDWHLIWPEMLQQHDAPESPKSKEVA